MTPIIYGTEFSTYVRSVRMAFEEKGVEYKLNDVSVLKGEQKQPTHLARNPFGTVPNGLRTRCAGCFCSPVSTLTSWILYSAPFSSNAIRTLRTYVLNSVP